MTNKYPVHKIIITKPIKTDEGMFEMTVSKERCGQSFQVEFIQKSFIMKKVEYMFRKNIEFETFKYDQNFEFVHDLFDQIKSNFVQEVYPRDFKHAFDSNYLHFKYYLGKSINDLLSETEGNDYGIRN